MCKVKINDIFMSMKLKKKVMFHGNGERPWNIFVYMGAI